MKVTESHILFLHHILLLDLALSARNPTRTKYHIISSSWNIFWQIVPNEKLVNITVGSFTPIISSIRFETTQAFGSPLTGSMILDAILSTEDATLFNNPPVIIYRFFGQICSLERLSRCFLLFFCLCVCVYVCPLLGKVNCLLDFCTKRFCYVKSWPSSLSSWLFNTCFEINVIIFLFLLVVWIDNRLNSHMRCVS